jgi:hypothetical protein
VRAAIRPTSKKSPAPSTRSTPTGDAQALIFQVRRNNAMDAAVGAEIRCPMLTTEAAKLRTRFEELKKELVTPAA